MKQEPHKPNLITMGNSSSQYLNDVRMGLISLGELYLSQEAMRECDEEVRIKKAILEGRYTGHIYETYKLWHIVEEL